MGHHALDNGEWMMRAERQQQAMRQANYGYGTLTLCQLLSQRLRRPKPEPEDTTGLKMLEEFLAKRRRARDD